MNLVILLCPLCFWLIDAAPPPSTWSLTISCQYDNTYSSIFGSGAGGYFYTNNAPTQNVDPTSPQIQVGTASGQPKTSDSACDIYIPRLPSAFPTTGHFIPGFQYNLVGVGPMCDTDYTVTFTKHAVTI